MDVYIYEKGDHAPYPTIKQAPYPTIKQDPNFESDAGYAS
jgi:hypothetical protein